MMSSSISSTWLKLSCSRWKGEGWHRDWENFWCKEVHTLVPFLVIYLHYLSFLFLFFSFSFIFLSLPSFLFFAISLSLCLFLISFPCIDLSLGFGLHFFTLPFLFLFLFSYFPFTELSIDSISSSCLLQCLFTNSFHQFAFAPFNFLSLTQRHSNIPQCLWFFFNPPATSKELQCLEGDSFTLSPVSAPSPVEILFTNSPFKSLLSSPQVKSQQNQVRSRLVDQTRKQLVIVLQLWCFLVPWYRL